MKRMKSGKVTGADNVAAELWKAESLDLTLCLNGFSSRVIKDIHLTGKRTTVSIWKEKGKLSSDLAAV